MNCKNSYPYEMRHTRLALVFSVVRDNAEITCANSLQPISSLTYHSITLQTYFTNSKAGLLRGRCEPGNRGNSLLGSRRECLSPDSV